MHETLFLHPLFDVAQGVLVELAEFLKTVDFFADLHFVERFGAALVAALLFHMEALLAHEPQDSALLDAPRKTPDEAFRGFSLFPLYLDHTNDLLSSLQSEYYESHPNATNFIRVIRIIRIDCLLFTRDGYSPPVERPREDAGADGALPDHRLSPPG